MLRERAKGAFGFSFRAQNPDLLFLAFLENGKENHQKSEDLLCLPNS